MLSLSRIDITYICTVTVFAYSLRGATGFSAAAAMPLMGGWHQHRSGQRRGKSNLRHALFLRLIQTKVQRFRASFRFVQAALT